MIFLGCSIDEVVKGEDACFVNKWSLMTQWMKRASQGHEMFCHDQEVMG